MKIENEEQRVRIAKRAIERGCQRARARTNHFSGTERGTQDVEGWC